MLGPESCLEGHVTTCTIAETSEPPRHHLGGRDRSPLASCGRWTSAPALRMRGAGLTDAPAPGPPASLPCSGWQEPSCREVPDLRPQDLLRHPARPETPQSFLITWMPVCCLTQVEGRRVQG